MVAVAVRARRSFWEAYRLPQNCATCARSPEARAAWGCEEETEEEQLWIPCQDCTGGVETCETCEGSGFEAVRRCPFSILWPESIELLHLHEQWPGALPFAGGLYDQPAIYLSAMRILDAATSQLEHRIQEIQSKAKK